MADKPTYEALEAKIQSLEKEIAHRIESEKILCSLMNAVPDLLLVVDRNLNIRYSNCRDSKKPGATASKAPQTCYARLKGRSTPCDDCIAEQVFRSGRIAETHRTDPTDGRTFEIRVFPILNASGQVEMVVKHARDITEHKIMEAEHHDYETRIEQMQKMEAIGTLAGGIAHDFNNILVAVIGCAELALCDADEDSPLQENLQKILRAGTRARDLVHQILTFSRQDERELKPLQVTPLVKETLKMLRSTLPTTIEIRQEISSGLNNIMADATQIQQIIMNLCTNAAQAMEDEGGVMNVKLSQVNVNRSRLPNDQGLLPGQYNLLSIRDTGQGIAPDVIDKIFHPYFTTKIKGKGTGLGLSVVHGIVQSYGGFIRVKSKPGKGTSFDVYLPVSTQGPRQEISAVLDIPPMGDEHILVVDDEPLVTEVIREMLTLQGYRVTSTEGSFKALEIFQNAPDDFDLVLTDMTMPKMTGDRLSAKIKLIRPNIPVILCTGYSEKVAGMAAEDFGVQDLVIKPIQHAVLAKIVRNVLDRSPQEATARASA